MCQRQDEISSVSETQVTDSGHDNTSLSLHAFIYHERSESRGELLIDLLPLVLGEMPRAVPVMG